MAAAASFQSHLRLLQLAQYGLGAGNVALNRSNLHGVLQLAGSELETKGEEILLQLSDFSVSCSLLMDVNSFAFISLHHPLRSRLRQHA